MTLPVAGTGPNALEAAVLRIRNARGEPVGVGFLVSDDLALTCAHVVSAALGIPEDVGPAASSRIHVDVPLLPAGTDMTASVERWVPPGRSGDVAVLRLSAPPPGARPVRLVEAQDVWEHPMRAFGFPAGRPAGVWHSGVLRARQADGLVQADLAGDGHRVSRGFSGTPVWDERLVGVVGMMAVAELGNPAVSYLIPTGDLLGAWPELRELTLPPSPFRGLAAFREGDAAVFYGRGTESAELAGALAAERWVTVVGPSGSGKSSLAMAGVMPRLRAAGDSVVVLRPAAGGSPLSALAAALLPLLGPEPPGTERLTQIDQLTGRLRWQGLADLVPRLLERHESRHLLIVVDQFEELLALAPEAVEELAGVLFDDPLPRTVRVLTTMRADFLETALAHPRLGPAISRRVHALGPLGREQLREVVTAPIDAIPGVRYEPHLADRILADTGAEPGALPLLGFTLNELWQRQSHGLLTHRAYEELGGVTGALGAHAGRVWADVPAEDEAVARRLFTRLVRVPIGLAAATRRVAPRPELGDDEWHLAQRLAATRLLVIGRSAEGTETVELAHEALIGCWDKLAAWTAEDRSFLVWRESLRHDMDRWERGARAPDLLPTTASLIAAERWLREHGTGLSEAERDYLEWGRHHRLSQTRRRRWFRSAIGIVVALALMSGTLAAYAQRESRQRQALADSRALTQAAQDEARSDAARSAMLALAAYQTTPTQEARNELLRQYLTYAGTTRVLSGLLGTALEFQASQDGNVVFAMSELGHTMVYVHAAAGTVRSEPLPFAQVIRPVLAADGRRAAFATVDGTVGWFAVNPDATRPIGPVHRLGNYTGEGAGTAISADGRVIVVTTPGRLFWWEPDSGKSGTAPTPATVNGHLWIGPDGQSVITGTANAPLFTNEGLVVIDRITGRTRTVVPPAVDQTLLLSGDRTTVVICHQQGDQVVLSRRRVSGGAPLGRPFHSKNGTCKAADATGRRIVLLDDTLHLVDLDRRTVLSETPQLDGTLDYSPDLVSIGGRLYLIGRGASRITYTRMPTGPETFDVDHPILTSDGRAMIGVLKDGSRLQLRSTAPGESRLLAEVSRPKPFWRLRNDLLVRSPDGRLFADREGPNVVSVREVSTLRQLAQVTTPMPPTLDPNRPTAFAFTFDRTGHLVTRSGTQVQQWDLRTGTQVARFDAKVFHPMPQAGPSIGTFPYPAPNQIAVVVAGDPVIRIVDIRTGRTTRTLKTTSEAIGITFDDSGRYFVLLRRGSVLELWRRHPLRRELGLRSLAETPNQSFAAGFGDNGRFLLATDNAIRIYQIGQRAYLESYDLGQPSSPSGTGRYSFLHVAARGKTLLLNANGVVRALFLDPAMWERSLCGIIGNREFTAEERSSLPVRIPTKPVCPP